MRLRNGQVLRMTVVFEFSALYRYEVGTLVTVAHYRFESDAHGYIRPGVRLIRVRPPDGREFHLWRSEMEPVRVPKKKRALETA